MRTPSLPHLVGPRRAATRLAGAAAVTAAALLVAGCVAAPAGTPIPTSTLVPPAPTASVAPAGSSTGTEPSAPAPTPSPTGSLPPTAVPGGTNEPPTPAVTAPPVPTAPPPTHAPTPRPTGAPAALGTITGLAHAGPTCPVVQYPPDPACADKPVAGVAIVVADESGGVVGTATTNADGRFSIALPPGTYTLAPQPREGLMRTPGPRTVALTAGATVTVDFAYDTGIR